MPAASIARVLVDSPLPQLDRLLDYRIPDGMAGRRPRRAGLGAVAQRRALATGFVVELGVAAGLSRAR